MVLSVSSAHKATTNNIFIKITVKSSFLRMIKHSFEKSDLTERLADDKKEANT